MVLCLCSVLLLNIFLNFILSVCLWSVSAVMVVGGAPDPGSEWRFSPGPSVPLPPCCGLSAASRSSLCVILVLMAEFCART